MNDLDRQLAGRAVVAKVIADQVAGLVKAVRDAVEPNLEPGEHITAQLGDGSRVGKVTRTEVPQTVIVTDERALVDYLLENYPDEIVPSIRPSFMEHLRRQVKEHGNAFNPTTGEVIPGIEPGEGTPSYRVSPSPAGRELILSKLADLIAGGVLELPAAESDRRAAS